MMTKNAPEGVERIDPIRQGSSFWRKNQLTIVLKEIEGMA
jgi:hypothetical protein